MLMGAKRSSRVSWWNALELLGVLYKFRGNSARECSGSALGMLLKLLEVLRNAQEC